MYMYREEYFHQQLTKHSAHGVVSVPIVLLVVGGVMIVIFVVAKLYYFLKLDHCSLSINLSEFPTRLMG